MSLVIVFLLLLFVRVHPMLLRVKTWVAVSSSHWSTVSQEKVWKQRSRKLFQGDIYFCHEKGKQKQDCCPIYILNCSALRTESSHVKLKRDSSSLKGGLYWMINYIVIFKCDVGQVIDANRYNCSNCLICLLGCSKQAQQYSACLDKFSYHSGSKLKFHLFLCMSRIWTRNIFYGGSCCISSKIAKILRGSSLTHHLLLTHRHFTHKALFKQFTGSSPERIFELHKLLTKM